MTSKSDHANGTKVTFQALPQRRAYEEILLQIERAIAVGELSAGDRLPGERELAESFGVSRASVREALRVLETLGVVVARRGHGADSGSTVTDRASEGLASTLRFHTGLGQIPMLDFVDLRAVLEAESVARAAELESVGTAELYALIADQRATDTIADYHRIDANFHLELARISGNALLTLFMETIRGLIARAMVRGLTRLEDWRAERDRLIGEHVVIVERIEAHDPTGAREAVRAHILRFYQEVFREDLALLALSGEDRDPPAPS